MTDEEKLFTDAIGERLYLVTDEFEVSQLQLTMLSVFEVIQHLMTIDAVCFFEVINGGYDSKQFSDEHLAQCRTRLINFAQTQFENRN